MIVFYFRTKHAGGTESLIINLATELGRLGHPAAVAAYADSVICDQLVRRKAIFRFLDLSEIDARGLGGQVGPGDVVIGFDPYVGLEIFSGANPRLFFWNVLKGVLNEVNNTRFGPVDLLTRRQIRRLLEKKALVFMDGTCVEAIEDRFGMRIDEPVYLPVPIPTRERNAFRERTARERDVPAVTYVGRGEGWKYYPARRILEDLAAAGGKTRRFKMHILSNDTEYYRSRIEKEVALPAEGPVEIHYHQGLVGEALQDFLLRESDLHISMGTACLEGAALGIPSILIDPSEAPIRPDYRYRWLYETRQYCLGRFLTGSEKNYEGLPLSEIIERISADKRYADEISQKCFEYVAREHALHRIAPQFLHAAEGTGMRVGEYLDYCIRRNPLFRFGRRLKSFFGGMSHG